MYPISKDKIVMLLMYKIFIKLEVQRAHNIHCLFIQKLKSRENFSKFPLRFQQKFLMHKTKNGNDLCTGFKTIGQSMPGL